MQADVPPSLAPYGAPELSEPARVLASPATAHAAREEDQRLVESLLWQRHLEQADSEAREQLIMLHLPYARAVAGSLYRQHVKHETEYHEYVQWATVGMIEALDRYDPGRGAQFRTYAHMRILGAIRNGLEHISERQEQISLHRKLMAERLAAAQAGRDVSDPGKTPVELMRDIADIGAGLMLSFMLDDTGMLQNPDSVLPDGCYESLAFKHEQQRLRELINELTPREQSVIRLHYLQGMTYEDIARSLGITKGRISQLHAQALTRLRALLAP